MDREYKKLALIIIFFCILTFISSLASATGRHITTNCHYCQGWVDDYNQDADDIVKVNQDLDEIRRSISVDEQFIDKDKARIASIESMPPSPKKTEELDTANKALKNDQNDLKNHRQTQKEYQDDLFWLLDDEE